MDFYLKPTLFVPGTEFMDVTTALTADSFTTPYTSWQPSGSSATCAVGESADMNTQSNVVYTTFTTGAKPASVLSVPGNAIRLGRFIGVMEAGNWLISFRMYAGTNNMGSPFRMRAAIFKGNDPLGSGATLVQGGITTNSNTLSQGVYGLYSATIAIPEITLNNDYLFIPVAFEYMGTTKLTSTGRYLYIAQGNNSRISTTTLQPPATELVGMVGI